LETITARVLQALEVSKASKKWHDDGGQYINAPLVWLRKTPWLSLGDTQPAPRPAPKVGAFNADGTPFERDYERHDRLQREAAEKAKAAQGVAP
jgi:hypothetical protein